MHHTKTKADIGLTKVIADLTVKGYIPCIPLSEHQPYDVVAIVAGEKGYQGASQICNLAREWDRRGEVAKKLGGSKR